MSNAKKFGFLRRSNRRKTVAAMPHEELVAEIEEESGEVKGFTKFLHRLGLWIQKNRDGIKRTFLITLVAAILAIAATIYLSMKADKENEEYHALLKDYETHKLVPEGEERTKVFTELLNKSLELGGRFLVSNAGKNGYLMAALAALELKDQPGFAAHLEKFSSKHSFDNLGVITGVYAAFAYESNFELSKALKIYQNILPKLQKDKQDSLVKYHIARIYYLQNDLIHAEKMFNELKAIDQSKTPFGYVNEVNTYLALLQVKKIQQGVAITLPKEEPKENEKGETK